jgi:hypothetical protein
MAVSETTIEHPAKVLRVAYMLNELLGEARQAPLDDSGRRRLQEVTARSVREVAISLSPELLAELGDLDWLLGEEDLSPAELRIGQAQLAGWLAALSDELEGALSPG